VEAYYFSHDSNAKDDPKCVLLIEELGLEGYGIFWVLVEELRNQPEYKYPLKLIPALARRYNTTTPKMEVVIKNYGLFEVDKKDFFFSKSLNRRMKKVDAIKKINSQKGKKSGEVRAQKARKQEALLLELIDSDSTKPQLNSGSTADEQGQNYEKKRKEIKIKLSLRDKKIVESFQDIGSFKKWALEHLQGYEFSTRDTIFLDDTRFKIKNGYIYNITSESFLSAEDALSIWQYIFENRGEIVNKILSQT